MSIYTSFEMIADCKAGKAAGWIHFAKHFTTPCRLLLAHYGSGEEALRRFLQSMKPQLGDEEPATIRELMTRWRGRLLDLAGFKAQVQVEAPDLAVLSEAFADLTVLERQLVWLETMLYDIPSAAKIMRVSQGTIEQARTKANDLLRAKLDDWRITLLRDCGIALGEAARAAVPEDPIEFAGYIEIIDGRLSWQKRQEVERRLVESWYEVDHFCRIREADDVVGRSKELSDEEVKPYLALLGVELPKPPFWKRVLASR